MFTGLSCTSASGQKNRDFRPLKEVADLHASTSARTTFKELRFALRPDAFIKVFYLCTLHFYDSFERIPDVPDFRVCFHFIFRSHRM